MIIFQQLVIVNIFILYLLLFLEIKKQRKKLKDSYPAIIEQAP